jgi:hypothetical protein
MNVLDLTKKSSEKIEFGQILHNLRSNLIEFDHQGRIQPNSTFEFKFQNSKNQNSNEFEPIRPSLQFTPKNWFL